MKNLLILGAILGSLALFSCGSDSSGGGGGQVTTQQNDANFATTPQPCNVDRNTGLPTNPNCQQYYNYYHNGGWGNPQWNHGAWYWPVHYQPTGTNCGCPAGYRAVYGQTFGLACAPVQYFNQSSFYFSWNLNWNLGGYAYWEMPQNVSSFSFGPTSYLPTNTVGNCQQSTAQGCDVRLNNQCPGGSTCRPVAGGSTIGLCSR